MEVLTLLLPNQHLRIKFRKCGFVTTFDLKGHHQSGCNMIFTFIILFVVS